MKKLVAVVLIGLSLAFNVKAEDKFDVYLYAVRAPLKTNSTWEAASAKIANAVYDGSFTNDIGNYLKIDFVSQDTRFFDGDVVWFVTKIIGKNGNRVNMNMLRFGQKSSDPANSLTNSYNLVGGNYTYSPQALGMIRGQDGTITQLSSGDGGRMVDELTFFGLQSTYYTYGDLSSLENIKGYVARNNLALSTWVEVVENNTVVARGARTLQTILSIERPSVNIMYTKTGLVSVGFSGAPDRTAVLQSAFSVKGPWVTEATVNPGDSIVRRSTNSPARIYRALLEPVIR